MTKLQKELKAKGIDTQEKLERYIQAQLDYQVAEGIAVRMENGNYRLKTEKELKQDLESIWFSR